MEVRSDFSFELGELDMPLVTSHDDSVSLHYSSCFCKDGGFRVDLRPIHIPVVEKLLAALRAKAEAAKPLGDPIDAEFTIDPKNESPSAEPAAQATPA